MEMNEMWGDTGTQAAVAAEKARFFRASKYAMFIHWGLYSVAGDIWQDKYCYGISEWLMHCQKIKVKDYETLAAQFNPVDFDAARLVAMVKSFGMKYLVITAKHHDGFAMFKSSHPYNIVDATPFGRDPMMELAEECRRQNIGLGFYYSQFQDWHEINRWDELDGRTPFEQYFENKCLPQIRELLTNYGKLAMIWFDTPGTITLEQSQKIVDLMRSLQPEALINSRIGNGVGDYSTFGDQEIPLVRQPGLWETIDTTNDSWGFAWYDTNFLSTKELLWRIVRMTARGGNYMLNLGPDGKGNIPQTAVDTLRNGGEWLARHAKAIYGADSSPWKNTQPWGDATRVGNYLYLFIRNWQPGQAIALHGLNQPVKRAIWRGHELNFDPTNLNFQKISLPMSRAVDLVEMVELEFANPVSDIDSFGIDPELETTLEVDLAKTENCQLASHSWMEKFGEWKHFSYVALDGENAAIKWEFEVEQPGLYRVDMCYQNPRQRAWRLVSDENESIHLWARNATAAGTTQRFVSFNAGIIKFNRPGRHSLKLQAETQLNYDDIGAEERQVYLEVHSITVQSYK
jgi:alpha-L-fucosidase